MSVTIEYQSGDALVVSVSYQVELLLLLPRSCYYLVVCFIPDAWLDVNLH